MEHDNKINKFIDGLLKQYNENITVKFEGIKNRDLVLYIVIGLVFFYISMKIQVNLSLIFFLGIATFICYYIYSKKRLKDVNKKEQNKIKLEMINPFAPKFHDYPDIIDFFYSIREFYYVNPNAFYALVKNTENFLTLYEQIMHDEMFYYNENVENAMEYVRNGLNHLQSMIYNLDIDRVVGEKFHNSLKSYHVMMYQYVDSIIKKSNENFASTNRKDPNAKYIDQYGPKAFNYFNDDTRHEPQFQIY